MSLTNTKDVYGWATIALHWIAAIGVIAMFASGIQAYQAEAMHDRAARAAAMGLHISIGATMFVFFAARIALHYTQTQPAKPAQSKLFNTLATASKHLLLLALLIQIISGPLAVWSGGRDIHAFNLFVLPSPFGGRNEGLHNIAEAMHMVGRLTILLILPLHVLGALKHLVFDRDGVFARMLWQRPLDKTAA